MEDDQRRLLDEDQRRLLEEAQRVARIGAFRWDFDRDELWYSDNMYRLFGMDPRTAQPQRPGTFLAEVADEDRPRMRELMSRAAPPGLLVETVFRRRTQPDRIFRLRARCDWKDGEPAVAWGTIQDVTEQHAQEQRRRSYEKRLEEAERLAGLGSFDANIRTGEARWSPGLYRLWGFDPSNPAPTSDEYLGMLDPEAADLHRSRFRKALARDDDRSYNYEFSRVGPDGRRHWYAVYAEIYDAPDGARARGTVQDITSRKRLAIQHQELAELGLRALRHGDVQSLFSEAAQVIARVLEVPLVGVLELTPEGNLESQAFVGWRPEEVAPFHPGPQTTTGEALRSARPVVIHDWTTEKRWQHPLLAAHGVRSSLVARIGGIDHPYGVLTAQSLRPNHFDSEDVWFLEALGGLLATALERLRAEAEVAELARMRGRLVADAVDAEERIRRRISEELHDGALQDLLAARQDLLQADHDVDNRCELVNNARAGVERAVRQLREAVGALHPVVLQHGGLETALQAAAEQAASRAGMAVDVQVGEGAAGVRDELVLSIARELLANAARHSRAEKVTVRVERRDGHIVLTVADDGVGADREAVARAPKEGHIGLASLAQRAEAVGGGMEIDSAAGAGTTVTVTLPVE